VVDGERDCVSVVQTCPPPTLSDGVALWNDLWRWCLFCSHG